jgi:purine-binding chemotaxis protein CheW
MRVEYNENKIRDRVLAMSFQDAMNRPDWRTLLDELSQDEAAREQQRLQRRAEQYAVPSPDDDTVDELRSFLAFRLGRERYAVDVSAVLGVQIVDHVTPVPGSPPFYRGVVNRRGQVLTVLDLCAFFEIEGSAFPDELVVVQGDHLQIGLLVQNAEGLVDVRDDEPQPVSQLPYVLGVLPDQLILLDIVQLLNDDRLIAKTMDDAYDRL